MKLTLTFKFLGCIMASPMFIIFFPIIWVSQEALKNLAANAGDIRDTDSIPG